MTTTIIVSDLHLGSRHCNTPLLSGFLNTSFDRLILNGDTINNLNFKKFKPKHWRIIAQLREIAKKRELVLIRGNHDGEVLEGHVFGQLDVLATLLGVPLQEEVRLEADGRRYVVLHGDRFDPTLHWPLLSDTADWCYQTTQKINKKVAKWLKQKAKKLGGAVEFLKQKSVAYAKSQDLDGVITGHTHFCDDDRLDSIHFLNTGCWVDNPCTYVAVTENHVKLCQWTDGSVVELPCRPNGKVDEVAVARG